MTAGCGEHNPRSTQNEINGKLHVDNPVSLKNSLFTLALNPSSVKGSSVTNVNLILSMPSMPMPPNTISMREIKPNVYVASGTFTMGGQWTVTAAGVINHIDVSLGDYTVNVKDSQ